MFQSKDGKKSLSKFRASHRDKMQELGGPRSQANKIEGKPSKEAGEIPNEENLEEQVHPGIHEEVGDLAAEHGPAHTVTINHDHEGGRHTVHSSHPDGHEQDADFENAHEAHKHAKKAAGVMDENEGEEAPAQSTGDDDYEVPGLD